MGKFLGDIIPETREAALCAIAEVAEKGDEHVIAIVTGFLLSANREARVVALRALPYVEEKTRVITTACRYLEDVEREVRHAAGQALISVAQIGDENVICSLIDRLQHQNFGTRRAALDVMASISRQDDPRTISLILTHTRDENVTVREAALQSLSKIVSKPNENVVSETMYCLKDEDCKARRAAVQALAAIAEKTGKDVSCVMRSCEEDEDWWVRHHATQAIKRASA